MAHKPIIMKIEVIKGVSGYLVRVYTLGTETNVTVTCE